MTSYLFAVDSSKAGLSESFTGTTFPPDGWTVYNFGGGDAWSRYTSYYHTEPACARIYYDVPNNDWLITPRLTVQGGDTLKFWWRAQSTAYEETLWVRVSINPDVSDTSSYYGVDIVKNNLIEWTQKVVDLSAYAGQDVYIAFHYACHNNYGFAIDDVTGPTPITDGPQGYYRIEDPPHWYHPPIKVYPNGSRVIIFKLFSIGTEDLMYHVVGDHPCIEGGIGPMVLPPGDSVTLQLQVKGDGACNGTFIAGNVLLSTNEGGGKTDSLRVHAVVSFDYYECPRDTETYDTRENGVLRLHTNANCEEWIHDIGTRPDTTFETFFKGGTIVATTRDGDTLVGRFMGENDWRAGAQDKLYTVECNVDWEPDFWLLHTKEIYIEAFDLTPPTQLKWWWWEVSKQIKIFKPGAPEVYQHIVIKYVTVTRKDPPGWWPDQSPFTDYEDTYIGMAMDINCPWDTLGYEMARNRAGYDDSRQIAWLQGFDYTGAHPEYNNYYAGMALADGGTETSTTPYGVDIVKNNRYLYPTPPWGWKDGELYQLASTPGVYIQDSDSLVDRSIVLTARMIPAGVDTLAVATFTVIEAVAPNGLAQLQEYVDSARAIVTREREHGIPAICGDVDGNGNVNQDDVDYLVSYLEESGPPPPCPIGRADVNGNGVIETGDVATLEEYLDNGGELDCPGISSLRKGYTGLYGYVYFDCNGDGVWQTRDPDENPGGPVLIHIYKTATDPTPFATATMQPGSGIFSFYCNEKYCDFPSGWRTHPIWVGIEPWLSPFWQTQPVDRYEIQLIEGITNNGPLYFGWTYKGACCLPDGSCMPWVAMCHCEELGSDLRHWHFDTPCEMFPCDTCIVPPRGLLAWWPLDETGPPMAKDIAGLYNATHLNKPGFAAGKVNGAFRTNWNFSPMNRGAARTSRDPFEQIKYGDFTIDAWVYPENLLLGGAWLPELDRLIMSNAGWKGVWFFVRTDPTTGLGRIALGMGPHSNTPLWFFTSTYPVVPNQWNHVAVTVSRSTGEGKFYHNGTQIPTTVGPTFTPGTESVFGGALEIGHSNPTGTPGGCGWTNRYFSGLIDELQIFNRALDQSEIWNIYGAGSWGKCRDVCNLPYSVSFALNQTAATTYLTICNASHDPADFEWSVAGLLAAGQSPCNYNGTMTQFTPHTGLLSVPPYECRKTQPITIFRPQGIPPFTMGDFACYEAIVKRTDPNSPSFSCRGGISVTDEWIYYLDTLHIPKDTNDVTVISLFPHDSVIVRYGVVNVADTSGLFRYEIDVFPGCQCDTSSDEIIVSLNGLPAGTKIVDSVNVPLGDSTIIPVNVKLLEYKPFNFQNIVLLTDEDGEMQPSISCAIHPLTFQDCNSNGQDDSLDIALGTSLDANSNGFPDECEAGPQECPYCYGALGEATVTCDTVTGTLTVSNVGSSGSDGIDLDSELDSEDDDGKWSITVANPDTSGTLPVGASLETEFFFATPSQPDSFSMAISMTKAAVNTWNLAVQSDASICSVKAFNNGSSVFSGVDIGTTGLGYVVESAKGVYPVGFKGGASSKPASVVVSSDYDFTDSPNGVQWTWPAHGVSNLQIDYLSTSTEVSDTSLVGVTHATICGDNGAKTDPISFTILDIEVELPFMRGDANRDGVINVTDVVYLINYLFLVPPGPAPQPWAAGDVNCDDVVNVNDVVYLINYLFVPGSPPPGCP